MFACVLALLPLALAVSASHLKARGVCSNGNINCCNMQTYQDSTDQLNQLGVDLASLNLPANALLGLDCSPIDIVDVMGGNSCAQQTVCCDGDSFDGLVNLGCNNINL